MSESEDIHIPNIAYEIPAESFFAWYNAKLSWIWDQMSLEEKNKYFEDVGENNLKKIEFQVKMKLNMDKDLLENRKPIGKTSSEFYFKLIEFSRLENDKETLRNASRRYFAEMAIKKMKEGEKTNE